MMKKFFSSILLVAGVLMLGSCTKSGPSFFQGVYGYAVSGGLRCEAAEGEGQPKDVTLSLAAEQGILHMESHGESMVMTTKSLSGSVMVWNVDVNGTELTLQPVVQRVTVSIPREIDNLPVDGTISKTVDMVVGGHGYKTAGMIVVDLYYVSDPFEITVYDTTTTYNIMESNVHLVANMQ